MWEEVGTPSKMTFSEGKEVMTYCPQVQGVLRYLGWSLWQLNQGDMTVLPL